MRRELPRWLRNVLVLGLEEGPSAIAHNESHVCDVALSPTKAKGHVAERRAAAPRSPRRLPRRRCTYVLLWAVTLLQ
jgi:hypothetical protein